ncbi:flagellar protein FlaG [Paenibacillus yanchengensis]|uniref:Flagellar protein FlaG n=1 Tax=Paenibacillus yanchengensis TaxID=2035833 RepID=A0ABW4YMU6_9BACL
MLGAINRMDGADRDWNQINSTDKKLNIRQQQEVEVLGQKKAERQLTEEDKQKLYKEVELVNNQLSALDRSFRIKFSEEAEQFYTQIIDARTQEVIESIPSEHMIELAGKLKEMIGFFIDEKR